MCHVILLNLRKLSWLLISGFYFATKIISFTFTIRTGTWGEKEGLARFLLWASIFNLSDTYICSVALLCIWMDSNCYFLLFILILALTCIPPEWSSFCMVFCWNFGVQLLQPFLCFIAVFLIASFFFFLLPFSFLALPSTARLCKRFGKLVIWRYLQRDRNSTL